MNAGENGYRVRAATSGNEISMAFEQRLRELVNQHAREIHILESENQRLLRINQALKSKASSKVLDEFPELIWGLDGDVQEPPKAPQAAETLSSAAVKGKEQKQTDTEAKAVGTAALSVKDARSVDARQAVIEAPISHNASRMSFASVDPSAVAPGLDEVKEPVTSPTAKFVISSNSTLGSTLIGISTFLILYVATIFPFKLCFLDFSLTSEPSEGWEMVEAVTQWLFIFDLFINFFLSYEDKDGNEVFDLKRIAKTYVSTFMFWVNFVACIPEAFVGWLVTSISGPDAYSGGANKALLILRLQRVTRIARMLRMAKLANILKFSFVRKLTKLRGPRMAGLAGSLFWAMHMLGCGWFLVAALHDDPADTWIFARGLEEADPAYQWITSMYFVLTVFTTVGFGDISASTVAEIFYAGTVMIIGTILNTVFLSEVINMLSSLDRKQIEIEQAVSNIQDFSEHTHLDDDLQVGLENYARNSSGGSMGLDAEQARKLFNGNYLPRDSLGQLSEEVFHGKLLKSALFQEVMSGHFTHRATIPPRLVLFVASMSVERNFLRDEHAYKKNEMTSSIFVVMSGTFSFVKSFQDKETPYKLMGLKTYFGQWEVLNELETRMHTTRCESHNASTVFIPKKEFLVLCKDNFPGYLKALRKLSWFHEFARNRREEKWEGLWTYKLLAGTTILHGYLDWRHHVLHGDNRFADTARDAQSEYFTQ